MSLPVADSQGRIIRVLTYGKESGEIDQAVVDAVEHGCRVLVKVASASDGSETVTIADWAEGLSRAHGLGWERVGGDVLFHRSAPPGGSRAR